MGPLNRKTPSVQSWANHLPPLQHSCVSGMPIFKKDVLLKDSLPPSVRQWRANQAALTLSTLRWDAPSSLSPLWGKGKYLFQNRTPFHIVPWTGHDKVRAKPATSVPLSWLSVIQERYPRVPLYTGIFTANGTYHKPGTQGTPFTKGGEVEKPWRASRHPASTPYTTYTLHHLHHTPPTTYTTHHLHHTPPTPAQALARPVPPQEVQFPEETPPPQITEAREASLCTY